MTYKNSKKYIKGDDGSVINMDNVVAIAPDINAYDNDIILYCYNGEMLRYVVNQEIIKYLSENNNFITVNKNLIFRKKCFYQTYIDDDDDDKYLLYLYVDYHNLSSHCYTTVSNDIFYINISKTSFKKISKLLTNDNNKK